MLIPRPCTRPHAAATQFLDDPSHRRARAAGRVVSDCTSRRSSILRYFHFLATAASRNLLSLASRAPAIRRCGHLRTLADCARIWRQRPIAADMSPHHGPEPVIPAALLANPGSAQVLRAGADVPRRQRTGLCRGASGARACAGATTAGSRAVKPDASRLTGMELHGAGDSSICFFPGCLKSATEKVQRRALKEMRAGAAAEG